jgi:hypothetical protein
LIEYGSSSNFGIIQETDDGGFMLSGNDNAAHLGFLKLDKDGKNPKIRVLMPNTPRTEAFGSIEGTSDGGFIISGYTPGQASAVPPRDALVIKLDKNLAVEWGNAYGGPLDDFGRHVFQIRNGGFVLVGVTERESQNCALIMKLDGRGTVIWAKDWGPDPCATDDLLSSVEIAGGNLIAVGSQAHGATAASGIFDGLVLRLDKNGEIDPLRPPKIFPTTLPDIEENKGGGTQFGTISPISKGFLIRGSTRITHDPVNGAQPDEPIVVKLGADGSLEHWSCPAIEDANFRVRDASKRVLKHPLNDWTLMAAQDPKSRQDDPIDHPGVKEVIIQFTSCKERIAIK